MGRSAAPSRPFRRDRDPPSLQGANRWRGGHERGPQARRHEWVSVLRYTLTDSDARTARHFLNSLTKIGPIPYTCLHQAICLIPLREGRQTAHHPQRNNRDRLILQALITE